MAKAMPFRKKSGARGGMAKAMPFLKKSGAQRDTSKAVSFRNTTQSILLTNIGQLVTLRGSVGPRRGRELGELNLIQDASVLCAAGKIVTVGTRREAARDKW